MTPRTERLARVCAAAIVDEASTFGDDDLAEQAGRAADAIRLNAYGFAGWVATVRGMERWVEWLVQVSLDDGRSVRFRRPSGDAVAFDVDLAARGVGVLSGDDGSARVIVPARHVTSIRVERIEERLTPERWEAQLRAEGLRVLDHDGWTESEWAAQTACTWQEFRDHLARCTVEGQQGLVSRLWGER